MNAIIARTLTVNPEQLRERPARVEGMRAGCTGPDCPPAGWRQASYEQPPQWASVFPQTLLPGQV